MSRLRVGKSRFAQKPQMWYIVLSTIASSILNASSMKKQQLFRSNSRLVFVDQRNFTRVWRLNGIRIAPER